ncbi:hypothetical protein [Pontiella sp.]|uniref:hypothetical protein n=1 Tax=Pontiella sp. TaxID=2837462 RepID=UPI003566B90A
MRTLLTTLKNKYRFIWDSGLLMATGVTANFLFIVFHALMKRSMGEVDYASLVALLGLLNVLALPVAAMTLTMSRFIAEHVHNNAIEVWVTIYKRAIRRIGMVSVGALVVWVALSPFLRKFFAAPSISCVLILGLIAVINLFKPVIVGVLQGSQRFAALAACNISIPISRIVLSMLAIWLGGRVSGVMGAVAVSAVISILIGAVPFRKMTANIEPISSYDTAHIYRYLFPVLLGQGALLLLMNADLVFFKRFLYGEYKALAPAYAQAATLSRAVILLTRPLIGAMFPRAVNSDNLKLFLGPFGFAFLVASGLALAISLFPEIPFKLMYGTDDPDCFRIARIYVWAALPISLSEIVIKYLWARNRMARVLTFIPVVVLYLVILFFFHRTPEQIIGCLAIGTWGTLVVLLGALIFKSRGDR